MDRHRIHFPQRFSDQLADKVVAGMGSWTFVSVQTIIVIFWISLNTIGLIKHWDVYPFILLNLLFSTQAAYASPVILLAANRQTAKDRVRDDLESDEVQGIYTMMKELDSINRKQLEILELLQQFGLRDRSNK